MYANLYLQPIQYQCHLLHAERFVPFLWKEGRKEHIYLTKVNDNTIHIYENAMVRRLSLRLNIAASATATEIIIIII